MISADRGERIVVGVDPDATCMAALRFAVAEAVLRRVEVRLVIAYSLPLDPDVDSFEIPDDALRSQHAELAQLAFDRVVRQLGVAAPNHDIVAAGSDPIALLVAESADASMVVLGLRHRQLLRRILRGQHHAVRMLRRAHVPIVVVPDDEAEFA